MFIILFSSKLIAIQTTIIDYKDLFHSLETSIGDYTSGAFDAYDKEDVQGLLTNRLQKSQSKLEDAPRTHKQTARMKAATKIAALTAGPPERVPIAGGCDLSAPVTSS